MNGLVMANIQKKNTLLLKYSSSEPLGGLEPPTHALRMRCSTN